MWGQAGPHFFRFNIYSSKEKYFEYLASKGNIFWDKTFSSHSDSELISMFKKNVTNKYFSG